MLSGTRIVNMEVLKTDLKCCLHCQAGEVNFVHFVNGKNRLMNKLLASSACTKVVVQVVFLLQPLRLY